MGWKKSNEIRNTRQAEFLCKAKLQIFQVSDYINNIFVRSNSGGIVFSFEISSGIV